MACGAMGSMIRNLELGIQVFFAKDSLIYAGTVVAVYRDKATIYGAYTISSTYPYVKISPYDVIMMTIVELKDLYSDLKTAEAFSGRLGPIEMLANVEDVKWEENPDE